MTADRSRRAFLASIGSVVVAGCTDGPGTDSQGRRTTNEYTSARSTSGTDVSTSHDGDPEPPESVESEWPVPGADIGKSNGTPGAAGPTDPVAKLWDVDVGAGPSGPVLADGRLYVGTDEGTIVALDAGTGVRRWRATVGSPTGAPRVVDGAVYVPTPTGLVSLDSSGGEKRWDLAIPNWSGLSVTPHGIYLVSTDDEPAVVALSLDAGRERWRTTIRDPWELPMFASDEHVFVSSGTHDSRFWTLAAEGGDVVGERPRSGADFPEEQFYLNGTVYAVDPLFGNVRATPVDARGGSWSKGVDAVGRSALSGDDEHVYYLANEGDRPGVYALSASDGGLDWSVTVTTETVNRPVAAGDGVLVLTDDELRCFAPSDGAERWSVPGDEFGEQFIVADDLVYTSTDGAVRAFRPPQ